MFSQEQFIQRIDEKTANGGKLLVLSGPTSVGKDTLIQALPPYVSGIPSRIVRSVSTKQPRQSESIPDYTPVSDSEFLEMMKNDALLEYTSYVRASNGLVYFGTPVSEFTTEEELLIWKVSPDRLVDIIKLIESTDPPLQSAVLPIYLGVKNLLTLYCRARDRAVSLSEWNTRLKPNFIQRLAEELSFWKEHENLLLPYLVLNSTDVPSCANIILQKLSQL